MKKSNKAKDLQRLLDSLGPGPKPLQDYVERRIRGQVCPRCGSTQLAYILRGLQAMNPLLEMLMLVEKVVFGGCMVGSGDKELYCNQCEMEFDRQKLNVRKSIEKRGKHLIDWA